jgi:multidrug transporter EmrE-like cation transporter
MIFVTVSILFFTLQALSNKEFCGRFSVAIEGLVLFIAFSSVIACILAALAGGFEIIPATAMVFAVLYGGMYLGATIFIVVSMKTGPLNITSIIYNSSMVINVIVGIAFWNEHLTKLKTAGIVMILIVLIIPGLLNRNNKKIQITGKWYAAVIGACLCNGLLTVVQKSAFIFHPELPIFAFNFWAFLCTLVVCVILTFLFLIRGERFKNWLAKKQPFFLCVSGMGTGTIMGAITQCASLNYLPGIVVYPAIQGGVLLAVWIISILFYKEKTGYVGLLMFPLGIAGIVLLNLSPPLF